MILKTKGILTFILLALITTASIAVASGHESNSGNRQAYSGTEKAGIKRSSIQPLRDKALMIESIIEAESVNCAIALLFFY